MNSAKKTNGLYMRRIEIFTNLAPDLLPLRQLFFLKMEGIEITFVYHRKPKPSDDEVPASYGRDFLLAISNHIYSRNNFLTV
jgi:hypothetical protein